MQNIKVLIVDDQAIICDGLSVMVGARPNLDVVGTANDGYEALEMVKNHRPDVVLMDLKMPRMNGVQATKAIKEQFPETHVVILTTYDEDDWIIDAVRAGANGYLLKDAGRDEIISAIEGTVAGEKPIDSAVAGKLFSYVQSGVPVQSSAVDEVGLTERELAILKLMATGLSNNGIGDRLHLAEGTVRNHVTHILGKLGVDDRTQAVVFAWRHGLARP
ncbi:MAG: DNA-binding NarL/FixJ family response regulator [Cellvibrionaceae bacterium]|jgi:DNA-binding NarL/FixJ family response regulator